MNWSMDFMSDALVQGRPFRGFNVIEDYNREALHIALDTSITGTQVIRELAELVEWRGRPKQILVDNGPEFVAEAMNKWREDNDIDLAYIQKGKPSQNAYAFESLRQAREITLTWMWM